jgi:hypothetical protein
MVKVVGMVGEFSRSVPAYVPVAPTGRLPAGNTTVYPAKMQEVGGTDLLAL